MSSVCELLKELVVEACQDGAEAAPQTLLDALAAISDAIAAISDHDRCNNLFSILFECLPCIHESGYGPPLSPQQRERWIETLRWLLRELRTWKRSDDAGHRKLIALLMVVQAAAPANILWPLLPEDIGKNSEFIAALEAAVRSSTVVFSARGQRPAPIWEQEAVSALSKADLEEDWAEIERLWPQFAAAVVPDTFLATAANGLARFGFYRLVAACCVLKQTPAAMMLANALPLEVRLRVAAASRNPHVQFCFVLSSMFECPRTERLPQAAQLALTEILCLVGADDLRWQSWMKVFNRYPVRYPAFHAPLGRALANLDDAALRTYVNAIELSAGQAASRTLVAECLAAFRANSPLDQRQKLWGLAHQCWKDWNFEAGEADRSLFHVGWSELDYAIVGFTIECMSEPQREAMIAKTIAKLSAVPNEWHASKADMLSSWYRVLSELQPYVHARRVVSAQGDWLPTTGHYVPDRAKEPYYRMMFGLKWNP